MRTASSALRRLLGVPEDRGGGGGVAPALLLLGPAAGLLIDRRIPFGARASSWRGYERYQLGEDDEILELIKLANIY